MSEDFIVDELLKFVKILLLINIIFEKIVLGIRNDNYHRYFYRPQDSCGKVMFS